MPCGRATGCGVGLALASASPAFCGGAAASALAMKSSSIRSEGYFGAGGVTRMRLLLDGGGADLAICLFSAAQGSISATDPG